jgi:hypothetical protein
MALWRVSDVDAEFGSVTEMPANFPFTIPYDKNKI